MRVSINPNSVYLIPILYEDAPNEMRNEPQRTHRHEVAFRRVGHKERNKKLRKFGAASQRNGISAVQLRVELSFSPGALLITENCTKFYHWLCCCVYTRL